MMPAMPAKPATTPIPVQLSESEFTQFILPHLTMPKRGPRCKLGYHRVFNLILGYCIRACSGSACPCPKTPTATRQFMTRPSTKSLPGGPTTVPSRTPLSPVWGICRTTINLICACCMAMAPTRWPKKAAMALAIQATNITRGESHRDH